MKSLNEKILFVAAIAVVLSFVAIFIAMPTFSATPVTVASASTVPNVSSSLNSTYGAYVYSTSPSVANVSVFMPFGSVNITSLRDITVVIFGSTSYNVSYGNVTVLTGFTTSVKYVNFTLGNGTYDLNVMLNGALYGQITDLHTSAFASMYAVEGVYIYSTYPGQAQQLYAAPGQSNVLMYPTWNITMYSSVPVTYTIYVNGSFVTSGKLIGTKVFSIDINASIGSAIVGLGNTVYKFSNLPISKVPLRKYYAPPPPALRFTAQVLDLYIIKAAVASGLSILAAIFIVGRLTVSKIERTVVG